MPAGNPPHWVSNHWLSIAASSPDSVPCKSRIGLPGVMPSPSVVNATVPNTACLGFPAASRATIIPCGTGPPAARTSASLVTSHSANRLARLRDCRPFRAARSATDPRRSGCPSRAGRTMRGRDTVPSAPAAAANANTETAGLATSRLPPRSTAFPSQSMTRSVPLFEISFIVGRW